MCTCVRPSAPGQLGQAPVPQRIWPQPQRLSAPGPCPSAPAYLAPGPAPQRTWPALPSPSAPGQRLLPAYVDVAVLEEGQHRVRLLAARAIARCAWLLDGQRVVPGVDFMAHAPV